MRSQRLVRATFSSAVRSLPATIDLANLGTTGVIIYGVDVNDQSGRWVTKAGDVNGDGFGRPADRAYRADASGNTKSDAGDSYVVFGGDFTASITHVEPQRAKR